MSVKTLYSASPAGLYFILCYFAHLILLKLCISKICPLMEEQFNSNLYYRLIKYKNTGAGLYIMLAVVSHRPLNHKYMWLLAINAQSASFRSWEAERAK